ncbi:MAG: HAMP domain-containing histidine kinase [Spirochaetales bacterium]|nr:HAMP domain-containing histidine kinase [Spirochaetales bacterium]
MKHRVSFAHPVIVFIIAQIAWISLVGMWIYLYISNWIILKKVGTKFSIEILTERVNIFMLISGIGLLLLILGGMYVIFIYLAKQVDIAKSYDNFIASVTHELKSPLASIQLYLETLKKRSIPEDRKEEFIRLMLKDTERLKNYIDSILEVSRIEQRRPIFNFAVLDGAETVKSIIEDFHYKNLRVISDDSGNIVADRDSLAIVVRNLLDNAFRYSRPESQVDIHMYCRKNTFIIDVKDRGIGIPLSDQKNIFNKFYRLRDPNKPRVTGSGLGLYMVKEIVKHHKGRVVVLSGGLGSGATFRVSFPLYSGLNRKLLKPLLNKHKSA